ncbi:hypothetical protein [Streptomyces sp. R44]|uniref:Uncharacterized protein n=1 Tax=Streptomyces sp. R44 TaxID=3238633 RepID=A0AB39TAX4_9ACTN
MQERILGAALEKFDTDHLVASKEGGHQTMHSVDHPQGAAVDENGRKSVFDFGEASDVFRVRPFGPGRNTGQ